MLTPRRRSASSGKWMVPVQLPQADAAWAQLAAAVVSGELEARAAKIGRYLDEETGELSDKYTTCIYVQVAAWCCLQLGAGFS